MNRLLLSAGARSALTAGTRQGFALGLAQNKVGIAAWATQGRFLSTFLPANEVTERVVSVVKAFEKVPAEKVSPKSHFINDLGLDSLDTVELVMAFEEEFVIEIPDDQAEKILTIEDAVKFISQHPQAK